MKIFSVFSLILLLSAVCGTAFSQAPLNQISGRVYGSGGEILPGATITVKGQNTGVTSAADGSYRITLPGSGTYTIIASYIGHRNQSKKAIAGVDRQINFYLQEEEFGLETVVVTGTRTPKLLKDVPIITRVLTAEDIKKVNVDHVGQLLEAELPGIDFSYTMDQQVAINLQGFGGNSVLFLVDGERLAGESMNNVDYNRLNLDNVERVEIVKGAASTLYGSSAIGGVINLITREPEDGWNLNLNTRFAEHNSRRYGGTFNLKRGKWSSQTNVQHTNSDNYNVPQGVYKTIYGNRIWNIKERLTFRPTEQLKLTARAGYYFRERKKTGDSKDRYRDFSGAIKAHYDLDRGSNLEVTYTFDQYDKSDFLTLTGKDIRDYSNVQHNVHTLYTYTLNEKHVFTAGADYMRDYLLSYQFTRNGSHRMHSADAFMQFDWNPNKFFNLITGIRFDYFSQSNVRNVSPHIGAMYKIGACSIRSSYSQGFRSPTLKEMYMDFFMNNTMMIYGNSDLKAEKSHNFALSAEYLKNRYNFTISGYYNITRNRIDIFSFRDTNGAIAQRYTNKEKVDITGIDMNLSAKYPCGVAGRISYGYVHEIMRDKQVRLSSTRPHSATASIEYGKSWKNYDFNISLNGRALSSVKTNRYKTSDLSGETIPVTYHGYTIWNLILTQNFKKSVHLNIAVNNLFNYVPGYYEQNSPYTRGTNLSIGVSVDVDRLLRK
ncbi:TonB-dependent receptor [Bacteroides pyogenes]|uniref:TonB-dependent receptor n=1 Tax=Bacteroides pyogenes TaxID=310300 RepID=UPI0011E3C12A|nr:TonB-dependent receptor [Bacteroides pyogenes]MBR8709584.1 Colicin I receptor [Bacteroides pyogenes]MBR8718415.1 Colicin I receptor [Bacteroides pyogenes]MBR8747904.1 Colicin I receptor [Bacteroides pyogenes]MBR8758228.1 Colicin I receptor [Bacteroides pyogenes]MBR8781455.1 Colicin I receptor [Bacteroides pyogenes]